MRLDVPAVPPSPNRVLGLHWSAKAGTKNEWILWIRSQCRPDGFTRQRRRVVITLYHSRLYDEDNAYASVKPVVDALKHWNLIWDDAAEWLELKVEQQKCSHKMRHTVIEIEPVDK